jgi:hypothetical protein
MNDARGLFWGGSRSTKLCIFPRKVAAGGDEGYKVALESTLCKLCEMVNILVVNKNLVTVLVVI